MPPRRSWIVSRVALSPQMHLYRGSRTSHSVSFKSPSTAKDSRFEHFLIESVL
jgi:hypothetical protein